MSKKSFFRQPKVSEILEGKHMLEVKERSGLVALINSCLPSFALYVDFPILPKHYNNAKHFLKYGNEAMIEFVSKDDETGIHIPPRQAIAMALQYAESPFASIAVRSRVDNTAVTRTLLDTCMQGMKLYAYALNNAPIHIEGPYKTPKNIAESGADFVVSVPSEEMKGDRHNVRFSNVPLYDSYSKRRLWTDIGAICDCDFSRWWITSRYAKERLFCQHAVAAYYAIAAESYKRGHITPSWATPFPIFSQETIKFWNKMRKQVVVNRGKQRRPLNSAERSLLLGEYIESHGVEEALYKAERNQ